MDFLPSVRVNDGLDTMEQWFPVVACDNSGQNVYAAWQDFRDIGYGSNVYFTRSTNFGQTFEISYCVNDTTTTGNSGQREPTIFYKNGIVYLTWQDLRDNYCVYFNKSGDGGLTFDQDVRVPDNPNAGGADPSIVVDDSGKIYIVWTDSRTFSSTGSDIYFSYSNDSGATFHPNVRVNDLLGNVAAWDGYPSVTVNINGKVFVAWESDRNDPSHSNFDIYSTAGEYVGIQEAKANRMKTVQLIIEPSIFRNSVKISFRASSLNKDQCVISIYDTAGRLVRQFSVHVFESMNAIIWDGRNSAGTVVSAGTYFVILTATNKIMQSAKAIKIR